MKKREQRLIEVDLLDLGRWIPLQYLYLRYPLEQVPFTVGEERDAEITNLETSRGDQSVGYD